MTISIVDSPVKKRRLDWIQETSDESFEERLFAGGYGGYGSTPIRNTPAEAHRHPPSGSHQGPSSLSKKQHTNTNSQNAPQPPSISSATSWGSLPSGLSQSTPSVDSGSEVATDGDVTDERILRRRRRMEAFRRGPLDDEQEIELRRKRLLPMELEGRGRVLVDLSVAGVPELLKEELSSPSKRRAKKRRGETPTDIQEMIGLSTGKKSRRGRHNARDGAARAEPVPNWPDEEFPWVLKTRERKEREEKEEIEKMKRIEKFLESDSEDEDDVEEELDPAQELNFVLDVAKW